MLYTFYIFLTILLIEYNERDEEHMDKVIIYNFPWYFTNHPIFPPAPLPRSQVLWALAPRAWLRLRALASLETEARPSLSLTGSTRSPLTAN